MFNPLLPDNPSYQIVVPYKSQYNIQETQDFASSAEMHRRAMFEIGNKYTAPDGRRYVSVDSNGEYQSCFVSQYSKIIYNNIEPKVKGVCKALHDKGYLTFGSCQGHSDSKIRWIGLVFNTVTQKQEFIKNVNSFNLDIHWYENHLDSKERPQKQEPWYSDVVKLHIVWDNCSLENASIDEKRNYPYTDADLTKFWNIQMARRYDHYESVLLVIGRKMVYENWIKQLWTYCTYDVNYIDTVTLQLEEKLSLLPLYEG